MVRMSQERHWMIELDREWCEWKIQQLTTSKSGSFAAHALEHSA